MAIITTDDLGAVLHREFDTDDGAYYLLADLAVAAACGIVKGYTHQELEESASDSVYLSGVRSSALLLPELPVTSVTSVTEDGEALTVAEEFFLDDISGILYRTSDDRYNLVNWSAGTRNIVVVYTHGYADDDMPADIKLVAASVAARVYDHTGVTQESVGSLTTTYESASAWLTAGERAVLDRYRQRGA